MAETTQAVQAKPKRGMSKSLRDSLVAYSFIAPNFIGFCIFTLVPMIFAIGLSFCNWDGVHPVEFTGISNFVALLSDKTFKAAFVNTLVYAIGTVPLTLVCSLGLAMLLNQKVKFRNFFRTVSFFPYVASLVAVAAVWNMIFSPSMGPVNQILATLGVENLPKWAAGKDPLCSRSSCSASGRTWAIIWSSTWPVCRAPTPNWRRLPNWTVPARGRLSGM